MHLFSGDPPPQVPEENTAWETADPTTAGGETLPDRVARFENDVSQRRAELHELL